MSTEIVNHLGLDIPTNVYNQGLSLVNNTITNLDERGLRQLSDGSSVDIDTYIANMLLETCKILLGAQKDFSSKTAVLSHIDRQIKDAARRVDVNYFIDTVFGEEVVMNWHHIQWGMIANKYKSIAILASRDHGKSFFWSNLYPIWKMWSYDKNDPSTSLNKKGFLFSYNENKAMDYLEIIQETIKENPILRERLYPDGNAREMFTKTQIKTKNGCSLKIKGFGSGARGYHPDWIVCDDVLTDAAIYSPSQREKAIDYFKGVVVPMLVPKGQLIVVGTPFHEKDLYHTFREGDNINRWKYMEYPAIKPNGKILWEGRYDYKLLMDRKEYLGNVIFSREFLCRPIANDSSLFPYNIIGKSIMGMENYKLINNIEASPITFQSVVIGCDFAISANVGADYTVFTTWGIDESENMWLLNIYRKVGATFNEQIGMVKTLNSNFRPNMVMMESNTFQTLYTQYLENTSIPIKGHHTGKNKYDLKNGLPSLAVLFERGKIKLPYGDEKSKMMSDVILSEFNSVTYTDKGLQSVSGHDDCPMSTWMARLAYTDSGGGNFQFDFI